MSKPIANNLLLDTHVWIWFINGDERLSTNNHMLINRAILKAKAFISTISVWEVSMLVNKQRVILEMPILEWVDQALELARINLASLSPKIMVDSCNLPGDFHQDPADRMIVATARIERLTLLTRDKNILNYSKNNYVSTIAV